MLADGEPCLVRYEAWELQYEEAVVAAGALSWGPGGLPPLQRCVASAAGRASGVAILRASRGAGAQGQHTPGTHRLRGMHDFCPFLRRALRAVWLVALAIKDLSSIVVGVRSTVVPMFCVGAVFMRCFECF